MMYQKLGEHGKFVCKTINFSSNLWWSRRIALLNLIYIYFAKMSLLNDVVEFKIYNTQQCDFLWCSKSCCNWLFYVHLWISLGVLSVVCLQGCCQTKGCFNHMRSGSIFLGAYSMRFQPILALKPIPNTHFNNIIASINSHMSNGIEAKEWKLLHKNLRGREEREPSKFPINQTT